jgi:hypothetical protein
LAKAGVRIARSSRSPRYDFLRGDERFQRLIHTLPWHPSLAFADSALARPERVAQ